MMRHHFYFHTTRADAFSLTAVLMYINNPDHVSSCCSAWAFFNGGLCAIVSSAGRVLLARSFIVSSSWTSSSLYWTPCLESFFGGQSSIKKPSVFHVCFSVAELALSLIFHSDLKHINL